MKWKHLKDVINAMSLEELEEEALIIDYERNICEPASITLAQEEIHEWVGQPVPISYLDDADRKRFRLKVKTGYPYFQIENNL